MSLLRLLAREHNSGLSIVVSCIFPPSLAQGFAFEDSSDAYADLLHRRAQPKAWGGQNVPTFERQLLHEPFKALPKFEHIETAGKKAKANNTAKHAPRLPPATQLAPGSSKNGGQTWRIAEAQDVQLNLQWTVTNASDMSFSLDPDIMQEATKAFHATVQRKQQERRPLPTSVIGAKREADEDDYAVPGSSSTFPNYALTVRD